jgi:phosphoribosylanthranilate isomerase
MSELTRSDGRLAAALQRGNLVKICGLREPGHAAAAAAAGADLIGFIFAPARRRISAAAARDCILAARAATPGREVVAVGVFVDAPADEIAAVVAEAGLDAVQLHGAEPPEFAQGLPAPALKVFRPTSAMRAADIAAEMDRYAAAPHPPAGFLIEGFASSAAGGAGVRADWETAAAIAAARPLLLGGGLSPENVAEAIRQVRPLGVDVSSGAEVDGHKDPARIEAFIAAARLAFPA